MKTTCDIEDGPHSVYEAVGHRFASLLQDLATEHACLKRENTNLLAQLECGLGGHIQRASSEARSVRSFTKVCIEDAKFDVINLEEIPANQVHVSTSKSGITEQEVEGPDTSPSDKSRSQWSSISSQTPSFKGVLKHVKSIVRQPSEVSLHYLWERSVESLEQGVPSKSLKGVSFKNSQSESVARGGDVLKENGCMQKFIIGPHAFRRMLWDLMSVLILSTDIVMVPLMVFDLPETPLLQALNMSCTIFWTLDIFASLLTGFYVEGRIEMRPHKVFKNYVRGWFIFDFLVVFVDWLLFASTSGFADIVGLLRISKLVRLGRILRAIRLVRLIRLVKMPTLLDDLQDHIKADGLTVASQVLKALITIAVANHFLACGWYAVGTASTPSWITQLDGRDLTFKYASALHWSLTQFTPASMEIFPKGLPERVYAICVLFLALVVFSSFVSSITNAMNHLRLTNEATSKQRANLRRFMQENRLSLDLTNRITAFAKHLRVRTKARVHELDIEVFKVLPEVLRLELHWEVYVPVLSIHPLLFHCVEWFEPFALELCNSALQEKTLLTGQELFSPDQEAKAMFFALSGSLEYYAGHTDIPTDRINRDEWCSEAAIWLLWVHEGQLAALTHSELVLLDAHVFRKGVAKDMPLFSVCRGYAMSFRERVLELSKDSHVDLFSGHDVALEISQRVFEPLIEERERESAERFGQQRGWNTWSKSLERISSKLAYRARSATA